MAIESSATAVTAVIDLRTCYKCGKGPQEGCKLRKCSGCSSAMYCSRECQKAAWSAHNRSSCRLMIKEASVYADFDHEVQRFGYASSMTLSQAIQDFVDAYAWAIEMAISSHALLRGCASTGKLKNSQEILRFRFRCISMVTAPTATRTHRNPAFAFKVVDSAFCSPNKYSAGDPSNVKSIANLLNSERDTSHKHFLTRKGPPNAALPSLLGDARYPSTRRLRQ
ncbi:hypothetical protein C8Q79DRAFT_570451 [Trametes meyenii]|nr:hypothetical protein C8Q79DRAFT_570451 [Trametes meyenii]